MKRLIPAALAALCLAGCAATNDALQVGTAVSSYSVTQATVDGIRAGYDGAFLVPAVAYRNLGICKTGVAPTIAAPCATRAIVTALQSADKQVQAALDATQAQITAGNATGAFAALATARTAITTAEALAVSLGITKGNRTMNIADIVSDIEAVLRVGTAVVQAGQDAAPYITQAYQLLTGATTLTDAQRQDLLAREAALRAELQAPILDDGA